MEQASMVRDVEVIHDGKAYNASYFVENDVIHARIGRRTLACPLGSTDAGGTVKALLTAYLLEARRKAVTARSWTDHLNRMGS